MGASLLAVAKYIYIILGNLTTMTTTAATTAKKTVGLDWQTITVQVNQAFLYICLPSLHDYDVKIPNFTFCGELEHRATTCFFYFLTLIQCFKI